MCKILLVDDEAIERTVLKKFLSKVDYITEIGEAENGREALSCFGKVEYDIVIMDIRMPGMDGIEAARQMKAIRDDCVVIFLTAYLNPEDSVDCFFSGGCAYLQKPVREHTLIQTISRFRASEKEKSKAPDLSKKLAEKILTKNYRAAKDALGELFAHEKDQTGGSLVDMKEACMGIAEEMLGTCREMGLGASLSSGDEKALMAEFSHINDLYLLQSWIFKVLDHVFNGIVQGQQGFSENEINVILNYLEKNYHKKVTLEEVADYLKISPFYLSKIFKKHTGVNFIDYITNLKIEKAKELLEFTEMPVVNIAIELSFNEPNYFSRVYAEMIEKIGHGRIRIFKKGGHPAIMSNSEGFKTVAEDFFREAPRNISGCGIGA